MWGALQQIVYRHKISDTELQQVLIDSWALVSQDTLNRATDQLPKKLRMVIKTKSGHIEFCLDEPCVLEIVFVSLYFQ